MRRQQYFVSFKQSLKMNNYVREANFLTILKFNLLKALSLVQILIKLFSITNTKINTILDI